MQARLSSSSEGWGTRSLDSDVADLGKCVEYVRGVRPRGRILIMGHSTGSQDVMHYAVSPLVDGEKSRPPVDAVILQASVSDREAHEMLSAREDLDRAIGVAKSYVDKGDGENVLPKELSGFMFPVSARRYLSLLSPGPDHSGQDDMFSSDLSDERLGQLFGKLGESKVPFQILYSGADQYVPPSLDKEGLVTRWIQIAKEHGGRPHEQSGVVPGLDHNGDNSSLEVVQRLVDRVIAFVESLG